MMDIQRQDKEYMLAARDYRAAIEREIDAKLDASIAKDKLLSLNPNDENMVGFGVSIKSTYTKGSIDYKRIVEECLPDIDRENFRKDGRNTLKINVSKES